MILSTQSMNRLDGGRGKGCKKHILFHIWGLFLVMVHWHLCEYPNRLFQRLVRQEPSIWRAFNVWVWIGGLSYSFCDQNPIANSEGKTAIDLFFFWLPFWLFKVWVPLRRMNWQLCVQYKQTFWFYGRLAEIYANWSWRYLLERESYHLGWWQMELPEL